ncbi:cupin domain-containing protein [Streptomyces sp. NPDC088748]|uniref:cupin domain-containing protein n=1 Tax=unclassified Streptomyces TaxID=2593676 RepID=UPI0009A4C08F
MTFLRLNAPSRTLYRPLWVLDTLATVYADAESTRGSLGLTEVLAPRGSGSTLHTHTREDEAFFVLDGRLRLWFGENLRSSLTEAGELRFLPRNKPHAFEVDSPTARFFVISSPAGFEEFYRLLGRDAKNSDIPPAGLEKVDSSQPLHVLTKLGVKVHGPRPDVQ